jgi:type IV secretory pathway TraG/TraD family ATPase VirD4
MSATIRRRGPGSAGDTLRACLPPAVPLVLWAVLLGEGWVWVAVSLFGGAMVIAVLVRKLLPPGRRGHIDRAAPLLAQPRDLRVLANRGARAEAARLGVTGTTPGVHLGRMIHGGRDLWASWELSHVDIWGPRSGKTSARAIPSVVAAPGAVVVSSSKKDVLDATRDLRARRGKVWVYDPHGMTGEPMTWWWNLLTMVGTSMASARQVASLFAATTRTPQTRTDGYFEPAAEALIASLLLAASVGEFPITVLLTWLLHKDVTTPVGVLVDAGHQTEAAPIEILASLPREQREGVTGTAIQMVAFLANPQATKWITPSPGRVEFRHDDFVRSGRETMYLLSAEKDRMVSPIALAMTAVCAVASEVYASRSPGGRLPVPTLFVLDDADSTVPWRLWPDKVSHYGSRGICVMAMFQSWEQGASVYGELGMAKLWSAAGVRVYGGGGAGPGFRSMLQQAAGYYEAPVTSTTRQTGHFWNKTVIRATRKEFVLSHADIAALPRGRALVQVTGTPVVLVRTSPWWERPYAAEIHAGITRSRKAQSPASRAAGPVFGPCGHTRRARRRRGHDSIGEPRRVSLGKRPYMSW